MPEESVEITETADARPLEMRFDGMGSGSASVVPATANASERTVDVVWYGGASVPRVNGKTGDPYMLRLDMAGANLDRLNAGAPVFDNHMSGGDFPSAMAGTLGTKAQIGVVLKAWPAGDKGMATLKFASGDPAADAVWSKVSQGIIQNLSFGTWINSMSPDDQVGPNGYEEDDEDQQGPQSFVATDWQPFEISPVCVPADYSTAFLSAEVAPKTTPAPEPVIQQRASAREENTPAMEQTTQATGNEAQAQLLAANTEALRQEALKEGVKAERARVQSIQLAAKPFAAQLEESFVSSLIEEGLSLEASREKLLVKLAANADRVQTRAEVMVTRDQTDTRRECMEAALLYRHDPKQYANVADKAREYAGCSLVEMAKESLEAIGVKTKGMSKQFVAAAALNGRTNETASYFASANASTSDFPSILANVANKSLRQAYEAYPSTFKPFCRMVTASDFKPLNRIQLSDLPALQSLNENGEYHRSTPTDSKETYSLATYGEVVAITRKVIINDDLQAFTRIPQLLGVAAARLEADKAWAVITANANMSDGNALFSAAHSNNISGAGSALQASALATARSTMRLQTAPQGTPLNLTPRFILVPAALEQTVDQLVAPINIASSDVTKVIPTWIRSLNPIVEPRLDAASTTAWYLVADGAMIDTVEYCYLEGQEGVYTETRQGFDVDGIEIKARMDFAAAVVEFRGLQKNAGA